ncbi:MAG TPA: ABC transporter permease [Longimicrobiales bacterium]
MRTIRFLVRKEFLQIFRDRATLVQMVMIPMVQLVLLSFAATFEVKTTRMHVVDLDRSSTSRALLSRFTATGRFDMVGYSASMEAANRDLLAGRATLILGIPADFEKALVTRGSAPVQLILNAEQGAAAGIVRGYATQILATHSADLAVEMRPAASSVRSPASATPARRMPGIDVSTRGWYNPDMNYKDYMVPGILVSLVTIIGTLLTAQNIAREKELGTLEQLNATPITRGQFIAAKLIPFWLVALVELTLGLGLARVLFGIPMEGNLAIVFLAAAIFLVGALGLGLWISTFAETQQQAMFIAFFILVVYLLLGGIYTPIDSMPRAIQWIAQANPITHFVVVMRAVLVRGAGIADVAGRLGILTLFAATILTLAVRQYHKTTG